jgi:hypothetical protein
MRNPPALTPCALALGVILLSTTSVSATECQGGMTFEEELNFVDVDGSMEHSIYLFDTNIGKFLTTAFNPEMTNSEGEVYAYHMLRRPDWSPHESFIILVKAYTDGTECSTNIFGFLTPDQASTYNNLVANENALTY